MTYRAADLPRLDADLTAGERARAGLGGVDAPHPLAILDPIPGVDEGVPVYQHPELLLAQSPALWRVVHEYRTCAGDRDLTRRDYRRRSAWWVDAWLTMRGAHQREEMRELERRREVPRG